MGGNTSKVENAIDSVSRDITSISNETITRNYTSTSSVNIFEIGAGCTLRGGRINQRNLVNLDVSAMQSAENLSELDAEISNEIDQVASMTRQALTVEFGGDHEVLNDVSLWNEMYTEITSKTLMECFANIVQENRIVFGENCSVTDTIIEQENIGNLVSNCVNEAMNENEKFSRFKNSISQDADMTTKGLLSGLFGGPIVMIVIVIAIVLILLK